MWSSRFIELFASILESIIDVVEVEYTTRRFIERMIGFIINVESVKKKNVYCAFYKIEIFIPPIYIPNLL